jgi:hypothetical protein
MSGSKYFIPDKRNRTPAERNDYRKMVERAPISDTEDLGKPPDKTGTDKLANEDVGEREPLPPRSAAVGLFVGGRGWQWVVQVLILLGLIIGAIYFFSNQAARTAENTTNIVNLKEQLAEQDKRQETYYNRLMDYINSKIADVKELFFRK